MRINHSNETGGEYSHSQRKSNSRLCFPVTRNTLYNAPLLLMTTTPQKRFIAALLPFSFLWVFIACVSICERETLAVHSPAHLSCAAGLNAIKDASECDGCPLSYFPKATTPERAKFIFGLETLSSFASIVPSIDSSQSSLFSQRIDRPIFEGSPPLTFLSTLRI